MSRPPLPPDDSWETDPVWKLLDQAPPRTASPRFAGDTLRSARLLRETSPWWRGLLSPVPLAALGALGAAAAAFTFAFLARPQATPSPYGPVAFAEVETQTFADIEELAETEALMAALDQLDDYSDHELVRLIGF